MHICALFYIYYCSLRSFSRIFTYSFLLCVLVYKKTKNNRWSHSSLEKSPLLKRTTLSTPGSSPTLPRTVSPTSLPSTQTITTPESIASDLRSGSPSDSTLYPRGIGVPGATQLFESLHVVSPLAGPKLVRSTQATPEKISSILDDQWEIVTWHIYTLVEQSVLFAYTQMALQSCLLRAAEVPPSTSATSYRVVEKDTEICRRFIQV